MYGESTPQPNAKGKLLLVDDELSVRKLLSQILTRSGYCVRCCAGGFSALSNLQHEVPDILLSDLNMPGMSGFELLSVVRRRFPAIKTIAMSGAYSGDDMPPGVAADAFYGKGANLKALIQIVDAMAAPSAHC